MRCSKPQWTYKWWRCHEELLSNVLANVTLLSPSTPFLVKYLASEILQQYLLNDKAERNDTSLGKKGAYSGVEDLQRFNIPRDLDDYAKLLVLQMTILPEMRRILANSFSVDIQVNLICGNGGICI